MVQKVHSCAVNGIRAISVGTWLSHEAENGKIWQNSEKRKRNSICSENCKKSVIFKNYSKKIEKICVNELYKSPLSLSVSDSELSVELLGSLSELKSVLEVAELSVDLDYEVLRFEFGILVAKSVIFWIPISTIYHTQSTRWTKGHLQCVLQLEFYFWKAIYSKFTHVIGIDQ